MIPVWPGFETEKFLATTDSLSGEAGNNLAGLLKSEFGRFGEFKTHLYNMREVKNLVFEQTAPKPA